MDTCLKVRIGAAVLGVDDQVDVQTAATNFRKDQAREINAATKALDSVQACAKTLDSAWLDYYQCFNNPDAVSNTSRERAPEQLESHRVRFSRAVDEDTYQQVSPRTSLASIPWN